MKRWSKIVCNFVFAVALGAIANHFDIPIDYEKGCSAAENAIKLIANSVGSRSLSCNVVRAAKDIYEIAKQHKDEKTLCMAINKLYLLTKKARLSCDKATISEYIKEPATL